MSCPLVVYNKFSADAVIAAAIINEELVVDVCDITQGIDPNRSEYIWVGIDPHLSFPDFVNRKGQLSECHHRVIIDNGHVTLMPAEGKLAKLLKVAIKTVIPKEEPFESIMDEDIPYSKDTLTKQVIEMYGFDIGKYQRLSFKIPQFFEKNGEREDVVFVYTNLVGAQRSLSTGTGFQVRHVTDKDDDELYDLDVQVAKMRLKNSYQKGTVLTKGVRETAIITTYGDFGYHMALRLIRMVHTNTVNVSFGMNGSVIFSNLNGIEKFNMPDEILMLS